MTYQTPPPPGAAWPGQPPRKPGFWQRLSPLQRVGLIAAALILPCCGGVTAIGALTGDEPESVTGADVADVRPIATTQAAATEAPTADGPTEEATAAAPATTTTSARPTPATVRKTVTATAKIPYKTKRVDDDTLAEGKTRVRTKGVTGIRTITYEVTTVGGQQTGRRVVGSEVTRKPVTKVIAVGTKTAPDDECDPNYTPCVPVASDVDCAGGSGNGPAYVDGPVTVIGDDIYDLDRDNDGTACD